MFLGRPFYAPKRILIRDSWKGVRMSHRFISFIKREHHENKLLFHSIPAMTVVFFVVSVVGMNLLANKSINFPADWLALDAGTLLSWMCFLSMDVITKHFGPKAANKVAIFALFINLLMCLLFFLASVIPGVWGESFVEGSESIINNALDRTFGGQWYVIFGSSVAFIASAFVNNFLSWGIGKLFHKDGRLAFYVRSYVSTGIGQFVDNLLFALIVSLNFFGWTITQVFVCAATGMLVELLLEVIFSPLGYYVSRKWKADNVGSEYLAFVQKEAK